MRTLFCFAFLLATIQLVAQDEAAPETRFANTITAEDLQRHLEVIASDEYEGRETGQPGQKKAAEYIANYFESIGIAPLQQLGGYYQDVALEMVHPGGGDISINGKTYTYLEDFYFFRGSSDTVIKLDEVQFLGYGINDNAYSDYKGQDVTGKVVMVLDGEPKNKKGEYYITGNKGQSVWTKRTHFKGREAAKHQAAALLIVVENMPSKVARVKKWLEKPSLNLAGSTPETKAKTNNIPRFFITREMANSILESSGKKVEKLKRKIDKKGETIALVSKADVQVSITTERTEISSENVLGFIEGTDLKHEVLVITAHYDHLGVTVDGIHNGADDDGSGTVCALEIAEAFRLAKLEGFGPRRSILIMTVTGEEKGLLGSEWYSDHPVFPLENTVANLNIDMVGRTDPHHDNGNYVYLIGSDKLSTELHAISEDANTTHTKLLLDYKYNDPNDPNRYYYRSDHYNFAKHKIPVIFYFSGVHKDYHKPTDTVEKIEFEKTAVIARLVFYTAWELANRDARIKVDVENDFED